MIKNFFLLMVFVFFPAVAMVGQENDIRGGLFFSSKEVDQDRRTSLNLTPEKPFEYSKGFDLEFEAKFRSGDGAYGNIIRIICNKNIKLDLIANIYDKDTPFDASFWLVFKDSVIARYEFPEFHEKKLDIWTTFSMGLDKKNASITLNIDGINKSAKIDKVLELETFEFIFGKSDYKGFSTTDVAPMILRNIKLSDKGKNIYKWPLVKHGKGGKVYDESNEVYAMSYYPKWQADHHLLWNKEGGFKFDELLGFAVDNKNERFFFVDAKAVYIYKVANGKIDTLTYKGNPITPLKFSFIYHPDYDELWSYSLDIKKVSKFNFENQEWSLKSPPEFFETSYWHPGEMISPIDSTLVTFGGYGFYRYKSVFASFDGKGNISEKLDKSGLIEPRYLSAVGKLNDDKFLIFGGLGSKSGDQIENTKYYYDLYSVNFKDYGIQKLWGGSEFEIAPFVPSKSMVVDSLSNSFLTLVYNNTKYNSTVKLGRFGIKERSFEILADSIPFKFKDTHSDLGLYYNETLKKLYAIASEDNLIHVSSINYPPLTEADVFQKEEEDVALGNQLWWLIILGVLIISGVFVFYKKSKSTKKVGGVKFAEKDEQEEYDTELLVETIQNKTKSERKKKSAIYLFGGFQVYDLKGEDVTSMFTPTLKQLFVLILLSSLKNKKGISPKRLNETIWFDKSKDSARNNRNVNISKLRILARDVGDLNIVNNNTYWSIEFGDNVFCDVNYVYPKLGVNSLASEEEILNLIDLVSYGEVCPDLQVDWIDDYRLEFNNHLIDKLELMATKMKRLDVRTKIADTILQFAPLNEDAISLKCRVLYDAGKKSLAKKSYDLFCKRYMELLDSPFPVSFKDLLNDSDK